MLVRIAVCVPLLVATFVVVGCGPDREVTTRTVIRQDEPRRPLNVEALKQQLHHTLVAVLPVDDVAWFFKISGPAASVESVKEDFLKFLTTLGPTESQGSPPSWELPDDWQETGASRMRAATIKVPTEKGEVEIAVSSLPFSGKWDEFLYVNVERWMRQLEQGPLSLDTIHKIAREVDSKAGEVTVLHLVGFSSSTTPPNPHAGMAMTPPTVESQEEKTEKRTPEVQSRGSLQYESPEGWQSGRMSSMRQAAFDIAEGDQRAEVTVSNFATSAGPMITDPVANIQRWARQVGIQNLDDKNVNELTQPIEIDGIEGTYLELLGPKEGEKPLAIFAVMLSREDKIWFFKLIGDREIVESQRDAFGDFLKSVSFR